MNVIPRSKGKEHLQITEKSEQMKQKDIEIMSPKEVAPNALSSCQ